MSDVVSFRPGVSQEGSAFEAMAAIYRYLQNEYEYNFTLLLSEEDSFTDDALDIQRIPDSAWKPVVPGVPVYPRRFTYRKHVDSAFTDADLVLTLDPTAYPQGVLGIRRADQTGTPVWIDSSATLNGDFELLRLFRRPFERSALKRTDRVLATVPKTVERFRDRRLYDGTTASRFEVLGHPVDTERFVPLDRSEGDGTVVLAVSRLVPEKGLLYVIEALTPLIRSIDGLEFYVLGDGPMREHLERQTKRRGISDDVTFLGTVPHEDVPSVLNRADIFVNHAVGNSHWEEFFGVANLEAMACGVPPVVSDSGGITYAIRRENVAEIVPQRNVVELRNALQRLIENPERREEMGKRAREYVVEQYSLERIGDRYHEMVQETLDGVVGAR